MNKLAAPIVKRISLRLRRADNIMFARRFDPDAIATEGAKKPVVLNRKRKLSAVEDPKEESESESEARSSSSSNSSDSDSSSESGSSSDEDENEPIRAQENDGHPEIFPENLPNSDDMELDEQDELTAKTEANTENDPDYVSKHALIFKKFQKAGETEHLENEAIEIESENFEDLAPIPQPELPRDQRLRSTQLHKQNLDWLTTPTYILPETQEPFQHFPISEKIQKNLQLLGLQNAFSVQVGTLRLILEDLRRNKFSPDFQGDILVNAATGSGKTLAYSIPIVEALHTRVVPRLRAIILVPTRPLINQVSQTLRDLSRGTVLSVVSLSSDLSIKEEGLKVTRLVPDILVTTPGRLVDHLHNGTISMRYLRFLVADEADRLLNQSFQDWSSVVVSHLEKWHTSPYKWALSPQKMIFSATLTTDAGKLSLLKFNKPRLLIVNAHEQLVNEMFSVPSTLAEYKIGFSSSKSAIKPLLLAKFLVHRGKLSLVLVFAKSNDSTLRLARILQLLFDRFAPHNKISVAYINSTNNKASVRKKIFEDFSANRIHVLVATDLIARGLDLVLITDVINYDLPNSSREYVHRVGRTARANKAGNAYTLCFGRGEEKWFRTIMRDVGRSGEIVEESEGSLGLVVEKRDKEDFEDVMAQLGS